MIKCNLFKVLIAKKGNCLNICSYFLDILQISSNWFGNSSLTNSNFHQNLNFFVITYSSHFPRLIENKKNQTGPFEKKFCIKDSTKVYTKYGDFGNPYCKYPYLK